MSHPLYRTQYEILRCILLNVVILLLGHFISRHLQGFVPEQSLMETILMMIFASFLIWSFFLRVTLFYEDHLVFFYPLRLLFRKKTFAYDDIVSVTYGEYLGDNLVLAALFEVSEASANFQTTSNDPDFFPHLTFLMKKGFKKLCSVRFWDKHKVIKMYYLLRFLKQKGVRIEGFDVKNNDLADCKVAKIEMIFGTGEKHIRRKRVGKVQKDNSSGKFDKDNLIEFFMFLGLMALIFIAVLCFS